ncbi:MAG: transposase [Thermodesulfovibrionia bacterium]|nr:transposase [Thermodesulfovibrionia bacterium]
MTYNPDIHHRRSIRLKEYDYSQAGAYFVTICTASRECLFGIIEDAQMKMNDAGKMVQNVWHELPGRFSEIHLDEFIIMPNHIHGIILLVGAPLVGARFSKEDRAGTRPAPTLGDIIGAFKSITTHSYTEGVKQQQWQRYSDKLWQRNYYEHIIRSEPELNKIREYIVNNSLRWETDENYKN